MGVESAGYGESDRTVPPIAEITTAWALFWSSTQRRIGGEYPPVQFAELRSEARLPAW